MQRSRRYFLQCVTETMQTSIWVDGDGNVSTRDDIVTQSSTATTLQAQHLNAQETLVVGATDVGQHMTKTANDIGALQQKLNGNGTRLTSLEGSTVQQRLAELESRLAKRDLFVTPLAKEECPDGYEHVQTKEKCREFADYLKTQMLDDDVEFKQVYQDYRPYGCTIKDAPDWSHRWSKPWPWSKRYTFETSDYGTVFFNTNNSDVSIADATKTRLVCMRTPK
jgi:hypothetical protein